jgi:hypothetical protein
VTTYLGPEFDQSIILNLFLWKYWTRKKLNKLSVSNEINWVSPLALSLIGSSRQDIFCYERVLQSLGDYKFVDCLKVKFYHWLAHRPSAKCQTRIDGWRHRCYKKQSVYVMACYPNPRRFARPGLKWVLTQPTEFNNSPEDRVFWMHSQRFKLEDNGNNSGWNFTRGIKSSWKNKICSPIVMCHIVERCLRIKSQSFVVTLFALAEHPQMLAFQIGA